MCVVEYANLPNRVEIGNMRPARLSFRYNPPDRPSTRPTAIPHIRPSKCFLPAR